MCCLFAVFLCPGPKCRQSQEAPCPILNSHLCAWRTKKGNLRETGSLVKSTHTTIANWSGPRCKGKPLEKILSFQQTVLKQVDTLMQKMEPWPKLQILYNYKFKIDHMDLSIKCKTINPLEENKGKSLGYRIRQRVLALRETLRERRHKYRLGKIHKKWRIFIHNIFFKKNEN